MHPHAQLASSITNKMSNFPNIYREVRKFPKTDRIIIYCFIAFAYLVVIVPLLIFTFTGPTRKQSITQNDSLENFQGTVMRVYNDQANHNIRTAVLKNKYIFYVLPEWESKIEAGDSLCKKKGSFLLEVYKRHGEKIVLDYKPTIPTK